MRTGGGLEEDWMRIEQDWKDISVDFRSSDGCGWIAFGLVTPQDGLVTPPLRGLRADLFKKHPKSPKTQSFLYFSIRAFKLAANHEKQVFTFLPFYALI